jgi:S1-C subfamily serine protease
MKRPLASLLVLFCLVTPWQQASVAAAADAADGQASANIGTLKDYVGGDNARAGPVEVPQLGLLVYDAKATLESGQEIAGAAVADVVPAGAAARAGIQSTSPSNVTVAVVVGASVAAAVFFPPAVIGIALLAHMEAVKAHELIIAVDGNRVKNTLELMQAVANLKAGDVAYLAMVNKGHRLQIPVVVP